MLPLDTTLTFFAASVLLALSPGPDNVFVLLHSAVHGRKAGLLVVLGLCSGLLFHTAAVALGLAAVFAASAAAFTALKLLGAGYLLYLGWGAWHAPVGIADTATESAMSPLQTYLRGVMMNITNPKVAIFFLAFLPQFVPHDSTQPLLQLLLLSGVFMAMTFVVFVVYGMVAHAFRRWVIESATVQKWLRYSFATAFAGLGVKLAMTER